MFNNGLRTDEKQEGLLKRLKNIEDKTDNQLRAIEDQKIINWLLFNKLINKKLVMLREKK